MLQRVLNNKIILKNESKESKEAIEKKGSLFVPKQEDPHRFREGTVLKAGEECRAVKDGDKVMYDPRISASIFFEGEEHTLIQEDGVVGIF